MELITTTMPIQPSDESLQETTSVPPAGATSVAGMDLTPLESFELNSTKGNPSQEGSSSTTSSTINTAGNLLTQTTTISSQVPLRDPEGNTSTTQVGTSWTP